MADPILEVERLTKRFGDFTAVQDLTFEVEPEEVFGFLGPNGAGKSTTIKMLCGVLTPTSGSARALGCDLFTEADRVRAQIGYMSQKFSLLDDLTVRENLEYFGQLYGLQGAQLKDGIAQRIRELQLKPLENLLVAGLSTGEKQRVALASSTLHRPRMLFLDEPTSGVDPLRRRLFWEAMDDLVKDGMTILVTTHNLGEADQCDRLAFIMSGRLMAYGRPRALKEGMGRQVLELRSEKFRELQKEALKQPGIVSAELMGRGVRLALAAGQPTEAALAGLRGQGLSFEAGAPESPSLEDLFIDLVQQSRTQEA
jgi:ABC-2 type transport system ATP-binding protein